MSPSIRDRLAPIATRGATGRDRGAVFPIAMFFLAYLVFVAIYIGIHFVWPEFMSTAKAGTSNPDALDAIHWYDLFVFPIMPFVFLCMSAVYVNVRANRDAGRF